MIEIENAFDTVIRRLGGGRVSDRVGVSPPFDNADYILERYKVIVELKCLEEDKIKDSTMIEKASELYERELKKGRAPVIVFGQVQMTTEGFSQEFVRQIAKLYRKPIQKRIVKANKQIKTTKSALQKHDYQGLLLVVNENNRALDPQRAHFLLTEILKCANYSAINQVVYLTANLRAEHPDIKRPVCVWIPIARRYQPVITSALIADLQSAWFAYVSKVIGEPVFEHVSDNYEFMAGLTNRPMRR